MTKLKYKTYKALVKLADWIHTLIFSAPAAILLAPLDAVEAFGDWWGRRGEGRVLWFLGHPYRWTRPVVIRYARWLAAHTDMPPKLEKYQQTDRDIHNARIAAEISSPK